MNAPIMNNNINNSNEYVSDAHSTNATTGYYYHAAHALPPSRQDNFHHARDYSSARLHQAPPGRHIPSHSNQVATQSLRHGNPQVNIPSNPRRRWNTEGEQLAQPATPVSFEGASYQTKWPSLSKLAMSDVGKSLSLKPFVACRNVWCLDIFPFGTVASLLPYSPMIWDVVVRVRCIRPCPSMRGKTIKVSLGVDPRVLAASVEQEFDVEGESAVFSCYSCPEGMIPDFSFLSEMIEVSFSVAVDPFFKMCQNLCNVSQQRWFERSQNADIQFLLNDGTDALFAHRLILEMRAPHMASLLLEDARVAHPSAPHTVAIYDCDIATFQPLIEFVYTGSPPQILEHEESCIKMLKLANRFGVWQLKVLCEHMIVREYMGASNAVQYVLFAADNNCSLLKEAAMVEVANSLSQAIDDPRWGDLLRYDGMERSILQIHFHGSAHPVTDDAAAGGDIHELSIVDLYAILQDERVSLDIDHPREALLEKLTPVPTSSSSIDRFADSSADATMA